MAISLKDLNKTQQEAVKRTDGPMLILAGAGSGKTRTLTYRIAYLIQKKKVKPSQILTLTFTNKAAKEMKERIADLLGEAVAPTWTGTFHSVCARILRIEAEAAGYQKNFTIYDVDDQVRALKKVLSMVGLPQQKYPPKMLHSRLSRLKNQFLYPEDIKSQDDTEFEGLLPEIYKKYQAYLKSNNALDFDDLLMKPIELFSNNPKIQKKYVDKFQYILVDEYQDTNYAQYLLLKKLVNKQKNLCVVGDEDQAIYGWRGADIKNILDFNKDYPEAETFKLEENYRSRANILDAANAVVQNNKERIGKNLWTSREKGENILVSVTNDETDEAKRIVEIIHDELYTKKRSFKDIAILYRTNAQSRVLEDLLRRNAISYTIVGGVKFYDRKEIKDLLAYMKLIVNPADDVALKRIINFPLRGVGDTTVQKMEKFAEMEGISLFEATGRVGEIASISEAMGGRVTEFYQLIEKFIGLSNELSAVELVSTLAAESGITHHYQTEYDQYEAESRVNNIKEMFNSVAQFVIEREETGQESSLAAYLEEVSLMSDVDGWNSTSNAVTLMTLHAAKGLEFPVVCITGLEMGLLPLQKTHETNIKELEEERRLMYVGMTRAEETLYLSYATRRRKYGAYTDTMPSLFLDEIPKELLQIHTAKVQTKRGSRKKSTSRRKKIENYFNAHNTEDPDELFYRIGQPVYHSTFGKGQILNLEGHGDKMKITVHFTNEDITKKLLKQYANLSPIEN